jgi:hypothetical protein
MGYTREVESLVSVVKTGGFTRARAALVRNLDDHGVRIKVGATGTVPFDVRSAIKSDLIHKHGVLEEDLEPGSAVPVDDGSRASALQFGFDEKSGSRSVGGNRVLMRAQSGRSLYFEDNGCHHPNGSVMSMDRDTADSVIAMGFIIVENLETFYDFHKLNFKVPEHLQSYPVVFRGMPHVARQDTCEAFLTSYGAPVTVFPDFDPAGLAMALSVPLFDGILWPGEAALRDLLDLHGSRDLFDKQMVGARGRLLRGASGDLLTAWHMINAAGKGIAQEHFTKSL